MKVKVRKSHVRKIKALVKGKRTRAKDVESFVELAIVAAIKAAPKGKAKKSAKKAKRAVRKRTVKKANSAPAAPTAAA